MRNGLKHILIVAAILHSNRASYNQTHPGVLKGMIRELAQNPNDVCTQYELLQIYGDSEKTVPSIWKREIARILENMEEQKLLKYSHKREDKTTSLIDVIRITHPKGKDGSAIAQLIKTQKLVRKECMNYLKRTDKEDYDSYECSIGWICSFFNTDVSHRIVLSNMHRIVEEIMNSEKTDKNELLNRLGKKFISGIKNTDYSPYAYYTLLRSMQQKK